MSKDTLFKRADRTAWLLLGLAWLALRLPLWLMSHGADFDMESYARVAAALSEGRKLYGDPALAGRYPYLPLWALLLWGLNGLAGLLQVAPGLLFKLPGILADLGVTALIFLICSRLVSPVAPSQPSQRAWLGRPFWAALCWAANPVPALISAGHGQFDSLALALLLLAAWYLEFSENPRSDFAAALSLGFAISLKSWPLFFLPLFLKGFSNRGERLRFAALSLALPLLLLLPFAVSCGLGDTLGALSYTGSQAFSMPEALRGFFFGAGASAETYHAVAGAWRLLCVAILGLSWIAYTFGPWRFPLLAGMAFATLTLYVFAPGLAAQYLCWLLPFALLIPGRLALRHSLLALPALLVFYSLFAPEAFLRSGDWKQPALAPAFFLGWGIFNLVFWLLMLREWIGLWRLCRRPSGRLAFS